MENHRPPAGGDEGADQLERPQGRSEGPGGHEDVSPAQPGAATASSAVVGITSQSRSRARTTSSRNAARRARGSSKRQCRRAAIARGIPGRPAPLPTSAQGPVGGFLEQIEQTEGIGDVAVLEPLEIGRAHEVEAPGPEADQIRVTIEFALVGSHETT